MRSVRINLTQRVASGNRIDAIDELKGLAIGLVVLYHGEGVLGESNDIHGEVGVDIFLILSGFSLAMNSVEMPLRQFFLRRFFRIYPSYWIALGLFIWMEHRFYGATIGSENIWQHVVGIQSFSRLTYFSDISDPMWFISLIVAAYLVFACIRRRLDDLSLVIAVAGALTLAATIIYQANHHVGGYTALAVRIPSFFAGLIAGRLLCAGTGQLRFNLVLGLGLLCFYYQTFIRGVSNNYTLPAIGIIATWLGLRSYLVKSYPGRVFLTVFSLMGLISYEVYLFHQPFIRDYNTFVYAHYLNVLAPNHQQLLNGILVGLALTVAISVIVHKASTWALSNFTFWSADRKAVAK